MLAPQVTGDPDGPKGKGVTGLIPVAKPLWYGGAHGLTLQLTFQLISTL